MSLVPVCSTHDFQPLRKCRVNNVFVDAKSAAQFWQDMGWEIQWGRDAVEPLSDFARSIQLEQGAWGELTRRRRYTLYQSCCPHTVSPLDWADQRVLFSDLGWQRLLFYLCRALVQSRKVEKIDAAMNSLTEAQRVLIDYLTNQTDTANWPPLLHYALRERYYPHETERGYTAMLDRKPWEETVYEEDGALWWQERNFSSGMLFYAKQTKERVPTRAWLIQSYLLPLWLHLGRELYLKFADYDSGSLIRDGLAWVTDHWLKGIKHADYRMSNARYLAQLTGQAEKTWRRDVEGWIPELWQQSLCWLLSQYPALPAPQRMQPIFEKKLNCRSNNAAPGHSRYSDQEHVPWVAMEFVLAYAKWLPYRRDALGSDTMVMQWEWGVEAAYRYAGTWNTWYKTQPKQARELWDLAVLHPHGPSPQLL